MPKNDNSESMMSSLDTEDIASDESNECVYDELLDNKSSQVMQIVDSKDRITKNKLTRYEFVRIMGERTKQLTMGAKPLIKINKESEDLEFHEIALEELKLNMLPFKIKRPVIDKYEIWKLSELKIDHLSNLF
uniref:DNA-directed RNA polymerase n=1 Tax=viral metagenome TaxID=1070528 RepID=A0A6C0J674_9ZZZZ